jgi:2-dehydro-3-deoxyphosphogluconate aldolase/(4S)-4-hydroxy-2-oxoglutarate aldolase
MNSKELRNHLGQTGIVPILPVEEVDAAVKLADLLVEAGAPALEILFRSPTAPMALSAIKSRHPGLLVAAGTVLDGKGVDQALAAGADFLVSPALSPGLHAAVDARGAVLIPGVNTATEVQAARELGYRFMKFYPAWDFGERRLDEYARIYPDVGFLVTGHILPQMLAGFAALRNVVALGGTWMNSTEGAAGLSADIQTVRSARHGQG